ncbi:Protein FAR1-RELATED SEQUENCE 5 [Glycine max]|nr:Protein FAR1-RELATED SEQUENCE 5 [Glycine max]
MLEYTVSKARKKFFHTSSRKNLLPQLILTTAEEHSSVHSCGRLLPQECTEEDYFVYAYVILVNSICNMDEDQWTYDNTMSEEVDMDFEDEQYCGVNEGHVFATRDDVLHWAQTVAHENGFVAVIIRSNTYTGSRGRTSFVLIVCEMSSQYKCRKKEFVRRDTGIRKYGCPFKLRGKPVHGGEGWMVKLICGIHNHEFAKTLVGHPYAGRLTNDEKNIIADMTKSNEHNANNCTTIKQIYNARSAYHSSIRRDDTEMQHLMRLLERDQYIHGHRMKDEVVVCDLFWCHPDAVNTYKTNRYKLPLLDFVGVTPTGMTFSVGFAYLEGERVNNIVWALERFRGLFLRNDRLPVVIVTDRDLALMNALKIVFSECTNLLCRVESAHWALKRVLQNSLGDLCSVWDAINNMIMLQHAQIKTSFETSTHVVGHVYKKTLYKRLLGMVSRYALNEIAYEFERVRCFGNNPSSCGCVLRTTLGLPCACELQRYDGCSIPLDVVHMYWRRLSFSDQGLCEAEVSIKEEMDRIYKRFEELDVCDKVTFKSKLREFAYLDENSMCPPLSKVNTTGAPKKLMKRSQRSIKRDPSYWDSNNNTLVRRTASSSEPPKPARMIPMLDQFAPFIQGFIEDVVDVKADGNYGYQSVAALLDMGEESWAVMRNELIKELGK